MAASGPLNQIFEALGGLKAEVVALRRDVEELDRKSSKVSEAAAASRAGIHRRMDEIVDRIAPLEGGLDTVREDLAEVKSVTDEVTRWRHMGMGAIGVTGIAAAAISSLVTVYWNKIVATVTG